MRRRALLLAGVAAALPAVAVPVSPYDSVPLRIVRFSGQTFFFRDVWVPQKYRDWAVKHGRSKEFFVLEDEQTGVYSGGWRLA